MPASLIRNSNTPSSYKIPSATSQPTHVPDKNDWPPVLVPGLAEHPTLGVIRLDYDYPAAVGDVDHPDSYHYPVIYRVVPRLTFQMAQSGQLTLAVAVELDRAIQWLDQEADVNAITGDCGFMLWFQDRVRKLTSLPVFCHPSSNCHPFPVR